MSKPGQIEAYSFWKELFNVFHFMYLILLHGNRPEFRFTLYFFPLSGYSRNSGIKALKGLIYIL